MPLSPFDHYVARIGSGRRDEGDAAGRLRSPRGPAPARRRSASCRTRARRAAARRATRPRAATGWAAPRNANRAVSKMPDPESASGPAYSAGSPAARRASRRASTSRASSAGSAAWSLLAPSRRRRKYAVMPRDRVQRGLLVVKLDPMGTGPGAEGDFADRGGLGIAEFVRDFSTMPSGPLVRTCRISAKAMRAYSTSTRSTVMPRARCAYRYSLVAVSPWSSEDFGGQDLLFAAPAARRGASASQPALPRHESGGRLAAAPTPSLWRSYIRSIRICQ